MSESDLRDQLGLRYRYVDNLIGVYFEEDWFEDYGRDERAAVADFTDGTAEDIRRDTLAELHRMAAELSAEEFERDMRLLMRAYSPKTGERPYRAFADRVAGWIAESLDERPDPAAS